MNRASCSVALLLVSCGGAPARDPTPVPPASSVTPARSSEGAPLPPLEPAAAPPGVFFRLRIKNPEKLVAGALEGASIPVGMESLAEWFEDLAPTGLDRVVEWSGSIEAYLAQAPKGRRELSGAFTFPVRSVPAAVQALEAKGIRVERGLLGTHYFSDQSLDCAVGRALGRSPARVVCTGEDGELEKVMPYALRGLPLEQPSDADLHFAYDHRPLREAYGRQIRSLKLLASIGARQFHIEQPRFDRAVTEIAVGLAEELGHLSDDFEGVEGTLREERGSFRGEVAFTFAGDASWTVASLGELASREGPAPPLFDSLPATARSASYSRGLGSARTADIRRLLVDLVGGYAESEKVSPPIRQKLERVVDVLLDESGPTVQATGPVVVRGAEHTERLTAAWELYGTTRDRARIVRLLDDLAAVVSSKDFARLAAEFELAPSLRRRPVTLRGVPGAVVYEWKFPASIPKDLPEIADLGEPLGTSRESFERHLDSLEEGFVAVDSVGGVTWLSWGSDPEGIAEPLRALREKSTQRLADDPEIVELRRRSASAAAFVRLDSFAPLVSSFLEERTTRDFSKWLEATPSRGRVPLTYSIEADRGKKTELRFRYDLPAAFVTDAATLVFLASEAGQAADDLD